MLTPLAWLIRWLCLRGGLWLLRTLVLISSAALHLVCAVNWDVRPVVPLCWRRDQSRVALGGNKRTVFGILSIGGWHLWLQLGLIFERRTGRIVDIRIGSVGVLAAIIAIILRLRRDRVLHRIMSESLHARTHVLGSLWHKVFKLLIYPFGRRL